MGLEHRGTTTDEQTGARGAFTYRDARPRSMMARPLPAAGAAVLAAIVLVASYLLLNACGLHFALSFGLRDECPKIRTVRSSNLDAALERRRKLNGRIAGLERALSGMPCPPNEQSERADIPAGPGTEAGSDGQSGTEEGSDQQSGSAIREEDWENRDVALLEGCWSLDSDFSLMHPVTREVIGVERWKMCFDAEGAGSQTLTLDDSSICESDRTTAEFAPDGSLRIRDGENIPCTGGSVSGIYEGEKICRLDHEGGASCVSFQEETGVRANVRFRR